MFFRSLIKKGKAKIALIRTKMLNDFGSILNAKMQTGARNIKINMTDFSMNSFMLI